MKKINKDYIIETERLIIKLADYSFAQSFYDLIDEDVSKFMEWDWLNSPDEYCSLIDNRIKDSDSGKRWDAIIIEKKSWNMIWNFWIVHFDENINWIELWYWLAKKYWWLWYIKECVDRIKDVWFNDFWYERILIKATKENTNSTNVAKRCWFIFDWVLRKDAFIKWKYVDKAYYTLLKEDY